MDYHWILTLQWPVDRFGAPAASAGASGWATSTSSGTLPGPLVPGYTRSQALHDVTAAVKRGIGIAPDSGITSSVLFFSLAPDALTGSES